MEWRSENWLVEAGPSRDTSSLSFTGIVGAVNNTIDRAEDFVSRPSTDAQTADKLRKQVTLLRNAAAQFVTLGAF